LLGDEILHFIKLGGLDNPLARSLFKICGFMFLFLITFRNLNLFQAEQLQEAISGLVKELRQMRKKEP
jgi:hypothetical protein